MLISLTLNSEMSTQLFRTFSSLGRWLSLWWTLLPYQKSLCVLHRPYIVRGRFLSLCICRDAASNIVQYYVDIYKEFHAGGQLETQRWFMGGITWHDYLLGVTSLCLVLCVGTQGDGWPEVDLVEMIQLLRRARDICMEQSARSTDSKRVQRVVNATLLRFDRCDLESTGSTSDASRFTPQSLVEAPFTLDQVDAQYSDTPMVMHEISSVQAEANTMNNDILTNPMGDPAWAYLEQFLNLPDDEVLAGLSADLG